MQFLHIIFGTADEFKPLRELLFHISQYKTNLFRSGVGVGMRRPTFGSYITESCFLG